MSEMVIFPVGKESSADSYQTFCDENHPFVGSTWGEGEMFDRHGQRAVPFLGGSLMYNYELVLEPTGGAEARSDGVVVTQVDWPLDE